MRWLNRLLRRVRALARKEEIDQEMDEEMRFHLEMEAEELVRTRGLSPQEARRQAMLAFGGLERFREEGRDARGVRVLEDLVADVRYAGRMCSKRPGFAVVAVLTLALGIGATTAIFSVTYGVLLKPLPFAEPDRLVGMWHTAPELGVDLFNQSPATYFTYRDENRVFEDIGMWVPFPDVSITDRGEPERVQALYVTEGTLPILKVQPLLGRLFTKADAAPGSSDRTMLTHGYWQRRFGGARDIVGQTVTIDGEPHEVIGVLPSSFRFLDTNPAVLLPLRFDPADASVGGFSYNAIARLKPGVTMAQANEDVARMIPLVFERFPPGAGDQEIRLGPNVRPLSADVIGDVGRVLWILLGMVGIVLLIACANVANLFLVRAEGRRQEFAVRAALGASRGRLARVLLGESVTLALAGGLLGLVLARAVIGLLVWLAPPALPRVEEIGEMGLHPVVLLFTFAIAILAGLMFGLVSFVTFRTPSVTALKEGGRAGTEGPERHRARNTLAVAQVAFALVLLVFSGLMVRTFVALRQVDPGFTRPEEVQTFRIAIPEALVSDPQQTVRRHEQIVERLRQLPGVQSVGLSSSVTMDGVQYNSGILVEDFPDSGAQVFRRLRFIAPGYFETMGNRVLVGRTITWTDIYQDALVAVVSETLAREYWRNPADAIGKRIRLGTNVPWREIIGIVGNERDDGLNQAASSIVYWPMAMKLDGEPVVYRTMTYAVRSARVDSPGFLREIEEAVWSVNPNLPLADVQTLDDIRSGSLAQTSFALTMLVIAAAVALLLGVVGLYGVIAYIAAQRTREIGIRMALGARIVDVRKMFFRHGLWLTTTGIALGVGAALLLTRVMSAMLFEVSPADPMTYAAVSGVLAAASLLATYLPARRASRVDPVIALRADA